MMLLTKMNFLTKSFLSMRIATSHPACFFATEKKLNLPTRPKKPLTPYFRFLGEVRPQIVKENPNLSAIEVIKLCAKQYTHIDDAKRQKFELEFQKDQEEYLKKRVAYENNLTEEQKRQIREAKEAKVEKKERIEYRKRLRENGKPKKPLTGFLRYLLEYNTKHARDDKMHYREWQKMVAEKWLNLSDDAKKPYLEAAQIDNQKYKQELSKWELKMVRLGHIDLVRDAALIDHDRISKPKIRRQPISSDSE